MTQLLEKIYTLINEDLYLSCPVLSGNMRSYVRIVKIDNNEVTLEIDAPYYDMNEWRKTGVIKLTGATINGYTDYAYLVNKDGAFGTHNRSEGWVYRSLLDSLDAIKWSDPHPIVIINKLGG